MSRFAAVPTAALDDERLEALHIRVLTALCSYSDKDGWCRVGQDKIAARARTNTARVSESLTALADWGWLRKQRLGRRKVNVYQVIMDRAVDQDIDLPTEQVTASLAETANHRADDLPTEQVQLAATANPIGTPFSNTATTSSDARREIVDRILSKCGPGIADPSKTARPLMDLNARLDRWLSAYDLEAEILPVVEMQTMHPRSRPMADFRYIEMDIAAFHAKRLTPLPDPEKTHERTGQGASLNGHAKGRSGARSREQYRSGSLAAGNALLESLAETPADVPDRPEDRRAERVA